MNDPHGLALQERAHRPCPSCGVRFLGCFTTEGEIGRWCCGDCTAHGGDHEWPEEPQR